MFIFYVIYVELPIQVTSPIHYSLLWLMTIFVVVANSAIDWHTYSLLFWRKKLQDKKNTDCYFIFNILILGRRVIITSVFFCKLCYCSSTFPLYCSNFILKTKKNVNTKKIINSKEKEKERDTKRLFNSKILGRGNHWNCLSMFEDFLLLQITEYWRIEYSTDGFEEDRLSQKKGFNFILKICMGSRDYEFWSC